MGIRTGGGRDLGAIYIEGGGKYHKGTDMGDRGGRVIHQESCSCERNLFNLAQAVQGIYWPV